MKFRKRPVVIEATQWFKHGDHPKVRSTTYMEVAEMLGTSGCSRGEPYWNHSAMGMIDTLEGKHVVTPGDWIITGIKGELYPCRPDVFAATYESYVEPVNGARDCPDFPDACQCKSRRDVATR